MCARLNSGHAAVTPAVVKRKALELQPADGSMDPNAFRQATEVGPALALSKHLRFASGRLASLSSTHQVRSGLNKGGW